MSLEKATDIVDRLRLRSFEEHGGPGGIMTGWNLSEQDSELHRDAADEIARLREALIRAKKWGGMQGGWHGGTAVDLADWISNGMTGPLPPLPDYLSPNTELSRTHEKL